MTRITSILLLLGSSLPEARAEGIDFNRDIRPILSDKCFHCHGPDAQNQKSDYQLDTRDNALASLGGGFHGIVPGQPEESELHRRIHLASGDSDLMPPADSNRQLSAREKELLTTWIREGAEYDVHWSFKPLVRPELPLVEDAALQERVANPIDHFAFAKLARVDLSPAPPASLESRLRRASLTLTGLPPRVEDVGRALAADDANAAYAAFVDELLVSPDYAERQALRWLSAARYADTDGYQIDSERSNWPWRDWVIKAFGENMPFDRFTIEQLAGDMLPDATPEQVLASAFNRNHRQNAEGGALSDEFFVENVIDRVETTSTVWLGLTMGCARCHDHKSDPLTQREFYQLFGYFNNIGERGTGKGFQANPVQSFRSPLVELPASQVAALEEAQAEEVRARKGFSARRDAWIREAAESVEHKESAWTVQERFAETVVEQTDGRLVEEEDHALRFEGRPGSSSAYRLRFRPSTGSVVTGIRLDALPHSSFGQPRRLAPSVNGNFVLTGITVAVVGPDSGASRPVAIAAAAASFEQDKYPVAHAIDRNRKSGWAVFGQGVKAEPVSASFVLAEAVTLAAGEELEIRLAHESTFAGHHVGRFRLLVTDEEEAGRRAGLALPGPVHEALQVEAGKRSKAQAKVLTDHFRGFDEPTVKAAARVAAARKALDEAGARQVPVMVMRERDGERRPAYLLERGQYDAPDTSEELPRALPAALFPGAADEQPRDRLELARWVVSRENPLTARVVVNRIWQDHFGVGLVRTTEDFGSQSEPPSHPGLLDWLAVQFIESGWDVRALHRLIVTSATYQQHSGADAELRKRDPENRLLARGPRFRLDGFAIRDLALQASGLLDSRLGGPPVKPYQPEGLWNAVASNASTRYRIATGADLYRKSLYTYWKRAVNPPRQLIFDAGGREACDVGVRRTNTPLQALVLMNDETFVETARVLAERILSERDAEDDRLSLLYRRVIGLAATERQLSVLRGNLDFFRKHFASDPDEAARFLAVGAAPRDETIPPPDHAAWSAVAHLVLNLDAAITVQ